jgi:hypothetical protein
VTAGGSYGSRSLVAEVSSITSPSFVEWHEDSRVEPKLRERDSPANRLRQTRTNRERPVSVEETEQSGGGPQRASVVLPPRLDFPPDNASPFTCFEVSNEALRETLIDAGAKMDSAQSPPDADYVHLFGSVGAFVIPIPRTGRLKRFGGDPQRFDPTPLTGGRRAGRRPAASSASISSMSAAVFSQQDAPALEPSPARAGTRPSRATEQARPLLLAPDPGHCTGHCTRRALSQS